MTPGAVQGESSVRDLQRPIGWLVGGLIVGLGLLVAGLSWRAREAGREQLLARDAELVEAIFVREFERFRDTFSEFGAPLERGDFLSLAGTVSDLRGVLGVNVWDPAGAVRWAAFPDLRVLFPDRDVSEVNASRRALWRPSVRLETLFVDWDPAFSGETADLVEVWVAAPATDGARLAWAQYWIDGSSLRAEFVELDRRLWVQGGITWGAVVLLVGVSGALASQRLRRVGVELDAGRRSLEAANAELELAARASAVGAISAHLLHGLKNPLGGLRAYLRAQPGADEAQEAADRMQRLIQQTLHVLREEKRQGGILSLAELGEEMCARFGAVSSGGPGCEILNFPRNHETLCVGAFEARLALLILENLVANAREAVSGGPLTMRIVPGMEGEERLTLKVLDDGPGIPAEIRERLFEPGVRGRADGEGAGLGLAISRHLARAMGGDLRLVETDSGGSSFQLWIPFQRQHYPRQPSTS